MANGKNFCAPDIGLVTAFCPLTVVQTVVRPGFCGLQSETVTIGRHVKSLGSGRKDVSSGATGPK